MQKYVEINSQILVVARAEEFSRCGSMGGSGRHIKSVPLQRNKVSPLSWLNIGLHAPVKLRSLFGVTKNRCPKEVGLFMLGLLQDYRRTGCTRYLSEARELGKWLLSVRCNWGEWMSYCWGGPFDVQNLVHHLPAAKPNVSTTCYVARALHELGSLTNNPRLIKAALDSARFVSRRLYTELEGRSFYAIAPGELAFINNASLCGAAWCALAGTELDDQAMIAQALTVARQSASEQAPDGSWMYGEQYHPSVVGRYVGCNLEALCQLRDALDTDEFDSSIERGLNYYRKNLFTDDGVAKYCNNQLYPIDMQSVAQAIVTLLKVGGGSADLKLCARVVAHAVDLLYQPGKRKFAQQKTRWFTKRTTHTCKTQAWAYFSLAFYNRYSMEIKAAAG